MPNKKLSFFTGLLALLCLSACSERIYLPAMLNNDISYLPKPMATDSVKTRQYISGSIISGSGVGNTNDELTMGELNYSRAHTFNNINLAYGGYGFAGAYTNHTYTQTDSYYFSSRSFYGLGARASANFFLPTGRADIRIPGVELSYSKEFGDYLAYRKLVKDQPGFVIDDRSGLFSAGFTTEVIWHGAKTLSTQYGFRLFIGSNFGGPQTIADEYSSYRFAAISYFLKVKSFYILLEGGDATQFRVTYQF